MQMPGMDGETLGKAIRSDGRFASLTMIMVTSIGQRGDARRMESAGFDAYLSKPVRVSELLDCLTIVLAGKRDPLRTRPIVTRHSAREQHQEHAAFSGKQGRILLAEDNTVNQQVALGILSQLGLHADAVADGSEAVRALEMLPYDLVLMDVQMPVMDGLEATREIRSPHSAVLNRAIPIIAMTAHAMKGDREKCLDAGMNDYVTKPRMMESLWQSTAAGDRETAHRHAHSIKGAAGNVSSKSIVEVAIEMEHAAKSGNLEIITSRRRELEKRFESFRKVVKEMNHENTDS